MNFVDVVCIYWVLFGFSDWLSIVTLVLFGFCSGLLILIWLCWGSGWVLSLLAFVCQVPMGGLTWFAHQNHGQNHAFDPGSSRSSQEIDQS